MPRHDEPYMQPSEEISDGYLLAQDDEWCETCGKVRTETCPACGDDEVLHAA